MYVDAAVRLPSCSTRNEKCVQIDGLQVRSLFSYWIRSFTELRKMYIYIINVIKSSRHFWTLETHAQFSPAVSPGACPNIAD